MTNGLTVQTELIQRLLNQLPDAEQLDFTRFIAAILAVRYTGPYTVHNRNGVPHQIDLGQPIRLSIVHGERVGEPRQA